MVLARRRLNRQFVVAVLMAATLAALFTAWVTFRFGGVRLTEAVDDLGEAVVALGASVICLAAARRQSGRIRIAWMLIGVSALAWSLGEWAWSYYEVGLGRQVPFPSVADAGFLGAVPLAIAGILLLAAPTHRVVARLATVLDGAIIAGSLLAVSWILVLKTIYQAGGDSLWTQIISLAYPIGDVVILTMLLLLLTSRVRRQDRLRLTLLAGGLLANLLADSAFAYLTTVNSYGPAQPVDAGWVAGYLLIGLAAFRAWLLPAAVPQATDQPLGRARLLLPYIPICAAVIASVTQSLISGAVDEFLFYDLIVVALLVMIRQFMMLAENLTLNQTLKEQAAALTRREEHLRSLVVHSSDAAMLADSDGVIRIESGSVERILAYGPGELVGTRLSDLADSAARPALLSCLSDALKASAHPTSVSCPLRHKLGGWTHCEITVTNLLYLPSVDGLVVNIRDVSEKKQLEERVSHHVGHDPLTNLANRSAFRKALEEALGPADPVRPLSLLMIDIDDFKVVNEAFGADVGDQLLEAVAARLQQVVPPETLLARLRSDEFALLVPGTGVGVSASLAESILQSFGAPFRASQRDVSLLVSIGGAGVVNGRETASDLLRNADLALRRAKQDGRARYVRYLPSMRSDSNLDRTAA